MGPCYLQNASGTVNNLLAGGLGTRRSSRSAGTPGGLPDRVEREVPSATWAREGHRRPEGRDLHETTEGRAARPPRRSIPMTGARRYRFTLFWASVLVGLGVGMMALGVVTAGLIVFLPERHPHSLRTPPAAGRGRRAGRRLCRGRAAGHDRPAGPGVPRPAPAPGERPAEPPPVGGRAGGRSEPPHAGAGSPVVVEGAPLGGGPGGPGVPLGLSHVPGSRPGLQGGPSRTRLAASAPSTPPPEPLFHRPRNAFQATPDAGGFRARLSPMIPHGSAPWSLSGSSRA